MENPKSPILLRLSTACGHPRSEMINIKRITSCHICNQLSLAKNTASILSNHRVSSVLLSTSGPPQSLIVCKKTVIPCHICSQLSRTKTRASTLQNPRKPCDYIHLKNSANTQASYQPNTVNSFRSSTVWDSH